MTAQTALYQTPSRLQQQGDPLAQTQQCYYFPKGARIPLEPHDLWFVHQGFVKLTSVELEGNEVIVGLVSPSMVLGGSLTCLDPYEAVALSELQLLRLTTTDLETSAEVARMLLSALRRRLQHTEALLAILGQQRLGDRLWHLLLFLKQELGQPTAEGTRLQVRLTHVELASLLRSSRVSVTRLLNQMKRRGWIQFDRKRHLILQEVGWQPPSESPPLSSPFRM